MNQAAPTTSAATYTISGKPRMRLSSSARNTSSLTRTMSPPVSSTDRPTPTKPMARLAMNDGMRSFTWTSPLTRPMAAPASRATPMASTPTPAPPPPQQRPPDGQHAHAGELAAERAERQREEHGGGRHGAFHRQVDRSHDDDEGRAQRHHQRGHRRGGDAREVGDRQEVGAGQGQARHQRHQHQRGAPARENIGLRRRGPARALRNGGDHDLAAYLMGPRDGPQKSFQS